MIKSRILTSEDEDAWASVLQRLPQHDIYHTLDYNRAYIVNGDGALRAFVAEDAQDVLFHPFFVRRIDTALENGTLGPDLFDIETVYGYSGPLSTTLDPEFLSEAWTEFGRWCLSESIVAEFIRFNPMIGNNALVQNFSCNVVIDRKVVLVPLPMQESELWKNYSSVHRNMVRKAIKSGLTAEGPCSASDDCEAFELLYRQTMQRRNAAEYYCFSHEYFSFLYSRLDSWVKLFVVKRQSTVIAAALFLIHGKYMHYHLSASDPSFATLAPTNLLLHSAAIWGLQHGYRCLALGGGRTRNPDDSLLRFKSSVSRITAPFCFGTRVHDPIIYDRLCSDWMQSARRTVRPAHFMLYRLPITQSEEDLVQTDR